MSHKNYSKFSKKFTNTENEPMNGQVTIDDVVNTEDVEENNDSNIVTAGLSQVEDKVIEPIDQVSTTATIKQYAIGFVSGCEKLNVREKASKDSNVLCVIEKDSEVKVDFNAHTTKDFVKVTTSSGVEGYCMDKYITIK